MKRVQRYVALAVSALMLSPLVPANINRVYAEEKYVDGVHYIDAEDIDEDFVEEENSAEDYKALEDIPMGIVGDLPTSRFSLDNSLEENVLDSEDSMDSVDSDALDEELEIMTDDVASINATSGISVFSVNTTTSSITVHWLDSDSANSDYLLTASSAEPLQPNSSQIDVHSKAVSNTNTTTISDLAGGMQYTIHLCKKNSSGSYQKVAECTSSTRADFLILVGESLYSDSGIKSSLNTYKQDLRYKEGLGAEIMRVSKTSTATGVNKLTTAVDVKNAILNKFADGRGAKGFVIIGSDDDIATARVENGSDKWQSDLYYADINGTWTDSDNDGYFDDPCLDSNKYTPELYFGRINPNGVVTSKADQISYIKNYLTKVHNYRENGNKNLSETIRNRALIFNDADFCGYNAPASSYSKLFTNITNTGDLNETTNSKLISAFNSGYAMMNLMVHSSAECHQTITFNSEDSPVNYNTFMINNIKNQLTSGSPKFNYMNMYCCSGCQFENNNGTAIPNIGALYLFNSSTGLNITGATMSAGCLTDNTFYTDLENGYSIGKAFVDFCRSNTMFMNKQSSFVLLGDPTLKYTFNKPSSATPYISTNVAGSLYVENNTTYGRYYQATKGTPFTINIGDSDSTSVEATITGLPSGTTVVQGSKYRRITIPTAGTYYITMRVYNTDSNGNAINGYTEKFHVTVK